MKRKDWSVCSQNRVRVPKFVCIPNGLDSLKNKERSFRFAQTASISLNSVELSEFTSLRDIEKPPVLVALIGRLL